MGLVQFRVKILQYEDLQLLLMFVMLFIESLALNIFSFVEMLSYNNKSHKDKQGCNEELG